MFNNVALDVFIGLVFIYLLYSLLATILQEMIATRLAFRAKVLEKAILRMLEDGRTSTRFAYGDRLKGVLHLFGVWNILKNKTVAPWFYAHPLIKYLAEDNYYSKPAYLRAENFSKVMIELLRGFGFPESQAVQSIHNSIMDGTIYKLPINLKKDTENPNAVRPDSANPAIKVLQEENQNVLSIESLQYDKIKINQSTALFLKSIWQESGADVDLFKQKLEKWFDDTMERATGWYKRYTRIILFVIGLVVAISFNVDTIAIHRVLSKDKDAREKLVQLAIKSQDKLAPEVERQRKGETVSDSILKETYQMVAADAKEANSILGLGRVWSDTCKMCKELNENSKCSEKKETLKKAIDLIIDSIKPLKDKLASLVRERKTTPITLKDYPDSLALKLISLNEDIERDSTRVIAYLSNPAFKEYERINKLEARCVFIKNAIGNKWFVYAPNQSGGAETILGWLITALAITLGAPFWFDLLSKLIKIRGAGQKIDATDSGSGQTSSATNMNETKPVTVNVNSNSGEEAVG